MRRPLLVALVLVSLLSVPAGTALATAPAAATSAPVDATASTVMQQAENNSTTETPENGTSGGPTIASQARLTPVNFDEDHLSVSARETDQSYDTDGPFAVFTISQNVDAARIVESPATATVLEGGRQVKVTYDDDASPTEEDSLYHLELFFEDGSKKEIALYAAKTDVSVAAAELLEYSGFIREAQDTAEEYGYDTDPEGLTNFLTFITDRADLVDGFLTESAARLLAWIMLGARNWLTYILGFGLLALGMKWLVSRYGHLLESLQNDVGKSERKRRELELAYEENKQTADEHELDEVNAVGANAIYWGDAFGVRSPAQLARMAANGAHAREDGELKQVHGGVEDLDVETIQQSWLEPVIRENRIPTAKQALGELKATLEWMETQHNLGHLYRDTRDELEAMIDEIDREQQSFQPDEAVGNQTGGVAD